MNKFLTIVFFSLLSTAAFAAPSVKITSFVYTSQGTKVAELCGVVSDMTTNPTFVQITVDEGSKRPAVYNTLAGSDGKFCAVVITYYGTGSAKAL